MNYKYVLFLFLCLCRLCLCRRRPSGSSGSGDPETIIIAAFILLPNVGGWISYAIAQNLTNRLATLVWIQNTTLPHWVYYIPNTAYVVIWTMLYSLMGYASFIVYKECGGFTEDAALPLSLYGGQLLLNCTWSPIFYRFRKIVLGIIHYLILDMVAAMCTAYFFFVNPTASYLMLPYLIFLGFQTVLGVIVWRLNSDTSKFI